MQCLTCQLSCQQPAGGVTVKHPLWHPLGIGASPPKPGASSSHVCATDEMQKCSQTVSKGTHWQPTVHRSAHELDLEALQIASIPGCLHFMLSAPADSFKASKHLLGAS